MATTRIRARGTLAGVLVFAAACATLPEREGLMDVVGKDSSLTRAQVRVELRSMAPRFSGLLEELADALSDEAKTREGRREWLNFKTIVIPSMQAALFRPDPVAALVDAWALLHQLEDRMMVRMAEEGVPQEQQQRLLQVAKPRLAVMEKELERVWSAVSGEPDASRAREVVARWAQQHPLSEGIIARPSTEGLTSALSQEGNVQLLGAASILMETTEDLAARVDLQTLFIPRQIRWQEQLFLLEQLPDLAPLMALAERGLQGAEALPVWARDAEGRIFDRVAAERTALQTFVEAERQEVFTGLERERQALMSDMMRERATILQDAEALGTRLIDRAFDRAVGLALGVLGGFALLGILAALLMAGVLRRRGPSSGPGAGRRIWYSPPPRRRQT